MSEEEFFERAINRICKDYDYNFANELKNIYLKKDKKIQQKENIIKEVREYIERYEVIFGYYDANYDGISDTYSHNTVKEDLLKILDKENK